MRWWYGILMNSFFFTTMWALSTKYLNQSQQFKLQLLVLPIIYLLNVWYGKSVAIANSTNTPYFFVTLLSVSISALLSLLFTSTLLNGQVTPIQISGGVLVVIGLVIMQL